MSSDCESPEFESLPNLYQRWMDELLPEGIPREREATCLSCAMCPSGGEQVVNHSAYYNPATKCCTYFPDLPNYLAGRAARNDNAGARELRAIIERDDHPRGSANMRAVQPRQKYVTLYKEHHETVFGRDVEMRCPFVIGVDRPEGPLCGIWNERNSVCSTWFCKHNRGLTGRVFWQSVQSLLSALEWSLSWWALGEVLGDPAPAICTGARGVTSNIQVREDAWRLWKGSRLAFYDACADRVEALSIAEALAIAGMGARLQEIEVNTHYRELQSKALPERLRVTSVNVLAQTAHRATLQALGSTEPMDAPALLLPLLQYFDGRPTVAVMEAIRREHRVRLEAGLVRSLFDFGILVESRDG